ncbi:helix-turn-helix transcriptional regulator [Alcaligenes sp. Marseille-Q7550]
MSVIQDLIRLRKAHGLTQAELARLAGLSRMTVSKIERGQVDPQLSTLQELARVLGAQYLVVPIGLRKELEAFLASGGRYLGQDAGAAAPLSLADSLRERS